MDDQHEPGRANRPGEPTVPQRKPLGHVVPSWVADGSLFFVTICAQDRAARPLLRDGIASKLIESVAFLHDRGSWFARLFLVMADHIRALLSFPIGTAMEARVRAWKSYTAKTLKVRWQERFFDHRLRSEASADEKAFYIRANPVRAGLTSTPDEWPHVFDAFRRI